MLHVHLVRATHLFTRTRTRVWDTRHQALEHDEHPLLSKTAICLLRLKVPGEAHAPEAAAACNTLISAATFNTPNPSFDFKCGFKTSAPRQACLDISIWHAERLVAADGHFIWDTRSNSTSPRAAAHACPHASACSLAFLRASDIQDFMSRGLTSPAYIGSVQVHLRQLLHHLAQIVESRSFVLVPTLLSKEISAARVLQASCRQALARAHMLRVPRVAGAPNTWWAPETPVGQANYGEAHSRARFQMMAGRSLRVFVIGARDIPLSESSQFTRPCDTVKLASALGSEAGGILPQPPMFFQLQALDGKADPACGAEWLGQPAGANLRTGFLSFVTPSSAHLPHARLHQLGKDIMEEGCGEGGSGWGLMGWGRKAVWNEEAALSFSLPCDCVCLRVSLYEEVVSAASAPGHEHAHRNVLIGECLVEIPAPSDGEGRDGAGSGGGDGDLLAFNALARGGVMAGWLPLKQRGSDEFVSGRNLGGTTLTQLHVEMAYLPCSPSPSPTPTAPQPTKRDLQRGGEESEGGAVVGERVPEGTNLSADEALKLLQQLQETMAPAVGSTVQHGVQQDSASQADAGPSLMASRRWSDAGLKMGDVRVGAAGSEAAGWWGAGQGLVSATQRGTSGIGGELGKGDRRGTGREEPRELLAETSWSFLGDDAEDGEERERDVKQVKGDEEGSGCVGEGKRVGGDAADKAMDDSDAAEEPDPAFVRWMEKTDAREAQEEEELRERIASGGRVGGSRSVSRPGSVVLPGDEEWWERERQMEEEDEAIMREIERVREQVEAKEEEKRQLERQVEEDEYRIAKMRFRQNKALTRGSVRLDALVVHPKTEAELIDEADEKRIGSIGHRGKALEAAQALLERTQGRIKELVADLKQQEDLHNASVARMRYAMLWSKKEDLFSQRNRRLAEVRQEKVEQEKLAKFTIDKRKRLHDLQHTASQTQKEISRIEQVLTSITKINEIRVEARRLQQSTKKNQGGMSPIIFQTGFSSPGHTRYDSFVVANDPIEEEEEEEAVSYTPGFTPSAVRAARGPEVADTPAAASSYMSVGQSLLPESLAMTPARSRAITPSRSAASKR